LIELELEHGKDRSGPLSDILHAPAGQRSPADLMDEIRQLDEIRESQQEMIRNLEQQSSCWEASPETRAEVIRNLRIELGLDPDMDEGEEQL